MKLNYLFIIALFTFATAKAQQPILTKIMDGPCTGGTPKMVEIYASGSVDFSQYTLQLQSNANTTWGSNLDLSPLGMLTDGFVYIINNGGTATFNTEFPNVPAANLLEGSVVNFNGDDSIRIIETSTMSVVDQYGADGVDGTGETWEYSDSYASRIDGTGPDAGFTEANWAYNMTDALDNEGVCNSANSLDGIISAGSYSGTGSNTPEIIITNPNDGAMLPLGNFDLTISVRNFSVGNSTSDDGFIEYELDGNGVISKYDTSPVGFSGLSTGQHTITVELVDDMGASLSPAATDMVTFSVDTQNMVSDISMLRSGNMTDTYILTGEAYITYAQSFRNQKFLEDSSAAILVDDDNNVLTNLQRGDGVIGIAGKLNEFNGMLQFAPLDDLSPSSSQNRVTPEQVSISAIESNPEDYESELVSLQDVSFDEADGTKTFVDFEELTLSNSNGEDFTFYVGFPEAAYSGAMQGDGDVIPSGMMDVVGIITEDNGEYFITARDAGDIGTMSAETINLAAFSVSPNPVNDGQVLLQTPDQDKVDVKIYSSLGQEVLSKTRVHGRLDISGLPSGVYFIKVNGNGASATEKLIVR